MMLEKLNSNMEKKITVDHFLVPHTHMQTHINILTHTHFEID